VDPQASEARWVAVGRITRAHGVKGEVAVVPLSEVRSRFEPGSRLFLGQGVRSLTVLGARPHQSRLLVAFDEVKDRDTADSLRGEYLFVPADDVPDLPEGEFWPHQLVGCEVVTEHGRSLGRIREIMRTQANDVWAADGPSGEVLVPALKDAVVSVDLGQRRVVVREIPGLTGPEEPA
jgi:16S rRNA processing protein RimM